MPPSSPANRAVPAALSAAALALALGLPPSVPAVADSPDPAPAATTATPTPTAETAPDRTADARPDKPKFTDPPGQGSPVQPTEQPADPGTPAPSTSSKPRTAQPAPAQPAPAVPSEPAADATPTVPATSATEQPPTSAAPSSESNWNKPVSRSPSQAGRLERSGGSGSDAPSLAVPAGILLVTLSAGAFAWWGRNRLRAH